MTGLVTSSMGFARDLRSGRQHQQPEVSRNSCCPLHSKPQEREHFSAGWRSFSDFSLHIKVPESEEGQGAPGMVSPVTRHEHYWACLGQMKMEAWKMKPKNLDELWESCRLLSVLFQMTSSISYLSHCWDVWMQSSRLMGVIHNINYFSQDTMTLCSDVIVACLCIKNKV